jgi:putative ABC transport system substrate-binding protein
MRRREFITLLGGAAVAWPRAARAQQPAVPVVGIVGGGSAGDFAREMAGFRKGLNEAGYVEGQNVTVEHHWSEGKYDRLPALMSDHGRPPRGRHRDTYQQPCRACSESCDQDNPYSLRCR